MKRTHTQSEKGAVAIFVVLFCALFITIIVVSFVGVMLRNQNQAINADLADSAYDSALGGVEDAKRLLAWCQANGNPVGKCDRSSLELCSSTGQGLYGLLDEEVKIQRNEDSDGDAELEQAYTCVKIYPASTLSIPDLSRGQSTVISLESAGDYNQIEVGWSLRDNTASPACVSNNPSNLLLPRFGSEVGQWRKATSGTCSNGSVVPPLLKVQFVRLDGSSFTLTDFDNNPNPTRTATAFLYPTRLNASHSLLAANNSPDEPLPAYCPTVAPTIAAQPQCSKILTSSTMIGRPSSYLIITPIYSDADVWVSLKNSGSPVELNNVLDVDSTGRANDVFRRVRAQISLSESGVGTQGSYPTAAIEAARLCKAFSVTDQGRDFTNSGCSS